MFFTSARGVIERCCRKNNCDGDWEDHRVAKRFAQASKEVLYYGRIFDNDITATHEFTYEVSNLSALD